MIRPENKRMQDYLAKHGIVARAKYFVDGSLKGCWRIHNGDVPWTDAIREKLTDLGFVSFDGELLSKYEGNGGVLSVWVRGHEELL
jgi:hypothetical protein